jgi:hypothetical protein
MSYLILPHEPVAQQALNTSSKHELETSTSQQVGLVPRDVGTIDEEGVVLGPQMIAVGPLDLEHIKTLCTLEPRFWSEIHAPGKVREEIQGSVHQS